MVRCSASSMEQASSPTSFELAFDFDREGHDVQSGCYGLKKKGSGFSPRGNQSIRPGSQDSLAARYSVLATRYYLTPCFRLISLENSVTKFSSVPHPNCPAIARPPSANAFGEPAFHTAETAPPPN